MSQNTITITRTGDTITATLTQGRRLVATTTTRREDSPDFHDTLAHWMSAYGATIPPIPAP